MQKIENHHYDLNKTLKESEGWKIPNNSKLIKFFESYKRGEITGRTSTESNLVRNLFYLKIALENVKDFRQESLKKFLDNILNNKINNNSKPYALKSKNAILKVFSQYLRWRGVNPSILEIKINVKNPDIDIYSEEELKKLFSAKKSLLLDYMIAVLNSGGMRAEEFHNIRGSDLELPKGKDVYVKIHLRNLFSKTQGRTISLYDKKVLPIVKKYLAFRLSEGMKPEEPVCHITYNTGRNYFKEFGMKTINKPLTYHKFRHTTATRLSSKMNRQQMCIYFGWKFSSPMPDIYIKRSGVNMKDVEKTFANSDMEEVQMELEELRDYTKKGFQELINLVLKTTGESEKLKKLRIKELLKLQQQSREELKEMGIEYTPEAHEERLKNLEKKGIIVSPDP